MTTTEKMRLQLEPRNVAGKAVKALRKAGLVPIGVFGRGVEAYNAQVSERDFAKILREAGSTSLVEITLPSGEPQQVFIQEVQRHPVSRQILHADLYVVDLKSEVTHDVPVVAFGENKLIARGDAIINLALHTLSIRGLPADLPHQIDVDISGLVDTDDTILVRDINLGDKLHIMTPPDETVVSLTPARVVATDEEAVAEAEGESEPELVRQERDKEE